MPRVAQRARHVQERTGTTSSAHELGLDRLASLCSTPEGPDSLVPAPSPVRDGVTRWSEMHWDGSARRRNVESVTDRVGNRYPHPRAGSGGPGDV